MDVVSEQVLVHEVRDTKWSLGKRVANVSAPEEREMMVVFEVRCRLYMSDVVDGCPRDVGG